MIKIYILGFETNKTGKIELELKKLISRFEKRAARSRAYIKKAVAVRVAFSAASY